MAKAMTTAQIRCFTARGTLVAIGPKVRGIFRPVMEKVQIPQKVVRYIPGEKLLDGLITILAGARGLVEANKRVRPDRGLQLAFGRTGCAEQSVISETFNACTSENVTQMQEAATEIFQQYSAAYRHNYEQSLQLLDVDMTGMPCGKKAQMATKGYFAKQRNRRGRQLGRVAATWYREIVVDRLFDGKTQLPVCFQSLVKEAEEVLELDEAQRQQTVLRVDSHGGSQDDVNWALKRGYLVHVKEYSGNRAVKLAASVQTWYDDPKCPGRQAGWVTTPANEYVRPVQRIAVRTRKRNGQWGIGVVISALTAEQVVPLARLPIDRVSDPEAVLWAYVYFYDLRGGGVETTIKEDKQGLGITKRNKKRFEAQQVLVQLNTLAHNIIIWAQKWLAPACPRLQSFGIFRMVRDVFQYRGLVICNADGRLAQITLDQAEPLAKGICQGLQALLAPWHVAVILGEI